MNSIDVKLYSKNDTKTIIYLILFFLWHIILSIVTYYYNNNFNYVIWLNSAINIVFCILTIIGLYTRNTFFINSFENFKKNFFEGTLSHIKYYIVSSNIFNLTLYWKIENFRKSTNGKFNDYSDEELRKHLLLSITIMMITGIINIIITKKFTSYLKEYLNNFNAYQDKYSKILDSNNDFRIYSQDEKDATVTFLIMIFSIVSISNILLYLINTIRKGIDTIIIRKYIDIIIGFIVANSVSGIILLSLIIIGIHKRNIFLIKNYKRIPWNNILINAFIINAIQCIIYYFNGEKTSDDKTKFSITKLIILIFAVNVIRIIGFAYKNALYKVNSYLDKNTDNIVEEIKKYNKIKNLE